MNFDYMLIKWNFSFIIATLKIFFTKNYNFLAAKTTLTSKSDHSQNKAVLSSAVSLALEVSNKTGLKLANCIFFSLELKLWLIIFGAMSDCGSWATEIHF